MRLDSVHIKNFRLLADVSFSFSSDPSWPLTVIRAENGSGKTSILYALRWAMYGDLGVPQGMRLTSTAVPPGKSITVQVRVEFTTADPYSGDTVQYRLIRTCEETPGHGDSYVRSLERLRLLRLTDRGEEEVEEGKEAEIAAMLPFNLADIFFTNGDDVQRFIAGGQQAERARQDAVHKAIRQLLGLEQVEVAESHLVAVQREFRRALAAVGSEDLQLAQAGFDKVVDSIEQEQENQERIEQRIAIVGEQIRVDDREIDGIKGIGDLESIQARIKDLERDISHHAQEESGIRREIKELLSSEGLSRSLMGSQLEIGLANLDDLADRHVIPGHSVEVLIDRLQLGLCICGESLTAGHNRYIHVSNLIEEQREVTPRIQRLTALWHEARTRQAAAKSEADGGRSVTDRIRDFQDRFTQIKDMQRRKRSDLDLEQAKRGEIDEERIQMLAGRIQSNHGKRSQFNQQLGESRARLNGLEEEMRICKERVERAERQANLSKSAQRRSTVVSDLLNLTSGTLAQLKTNYVHRVSSRMNDLFLDIVGADPDANVNVFTGVRINDSNHDIVIDSLEGRTLDADTELNGASQRALTLSFIWALMEVAEREAPRIIDTPLGMTSGAVKQRMVEMLSRPTTQDGTQYQAILFMTRSEIRDIESLVAERAGTVITLTCSKDYPRDLVNDWSDDGPAVRMCNCNHQQVCSICERRRDAVSDRFARRVEV